MNEVNKINAKFKADRILKLLETNQIAISQLSFDLGELRKRLDLLEGELDSLFKK